MEAKKRFAKSGDIESFAKLLLDRNVLTRKENVMEDNVISVKELLKNGRVVKLRNGELFLVVGNTLIGTAGYTVLVNEYSDNGTVLERAGNINGKCAHDIMEVYPVTSTIDLKSHVECFKPLWERPEVIEVTMDEIREKFGCDIKIVRRPDPYDTTVNLNCWCDN